MLIDTDATEPQHDFIIRGEDVEGYAIMLTWALDTIGASKLEGEDHYRILQLQQLADSLLSFSKDFAGERCSSCGEVDHFCECRIESVY